MTRSIEYKWHLRRLMADAGMRNSKDLVAPLRARGITMSESQIYRLTAGKPERISIAVLVALADVFDADLKELLSYSATEIPERQGALRSGIQGSTAPLGTYRPVRARLDGLE